MAAPESALTLTLERAADGSLSPRRATLHDRATPALRADGERGWQILGAKGDVLATAAAPAFVNHRSVASPDGGGEAAEVSPRWFRVTIPWPDGAISLRIDDAIWPLHPTRHTRSSEHDVATLHPGLGDAPGLDLVLLSEGYTAADRDDFLQDAQTLVDHMLSVDPWAAYPGMLRIHAAFTPSVDGGIDRKPRENLVDSAFGCFYECGGVERLICCEERRIAQFLDETTPWADGALLLVDDEPYGGSGGLLYSTSYTGSYMTQVALHELSHSLVVLWDEYDYGISAPPGRSAGPNCAPPEATSLPWEPWMGDEGVDAFTECSYLDWLRPTDDACMMRTLQDRYCPVCREHVVQALYDAWGGGPLAKALPDTADVPLLPGNANLFATESIAPDDLTLWTWTLDGEPLDAQSSAVLLGCPHDARQLTVTVEDLTPWVRSDDPSPLVSSHTWTLDSQACPALPERIDPDEARSCGCASSRGVGALAPLLFASLLLLRRLESS